MNFQQLKPYLGVKNEREYKRGEIIYHEGDNPNKLFFVQSGLVGLFHISETGKETFLRVFGKDAIFGHRSYLAEEPYHATAIVLAPSLIISISKEECDRICQENPLFMKLMAKKLASDLGNTELRMAGLQDKSAFKRIAESMIFLKLRYPNHTWTRKEIAEFSGSTLESVARAMTDFESQGFIKKIGRDFEIIDYDLFYQY